MRADLLQPWSGNHPFFAVRTEAPDLSSASELIYGASVEFFLPAFRSANRMCAEDFAGRLQIFSVKPSTGFRLGRRDLAEPQKLRPLGPDPGSARSPLA